ncbi:MAG: DUF2855 family protein, partial [Pseudomonadota bacterium]
PNQARLKIDSLALTANNVTYAIFANFAGYWEFFPAGDAALGRVPHWGFATVEASNVDALPVGARIYGYLPVSTDLTIEPVAFDKTGFVDGSAHRANLPAFYNRFHLTQTDPAYHADYEDHQMLVRPLYATGWLIDDYMTTHKTPPNQVLVSSASSKTALAYAHKACEREGLTLTGLTSPGNVDFVKETGFYTHVLPYDQISEIPKLAPALYADFLGDPALRPKLSEALGDCFAGTVAIGATAWDADRSPIPSLGDTHGDVEMFFAPGHAEACAKRMGPVPFFSAMNGDMRDFYPVSAKLIKARHIQGRKEIIEAWHDTMDGKIAPTDGLILKL